MKHTHWICMLVFVTPDELRMLSPLQDTVTFAYIGIVCHKNAGASGQATNNVPSFPPPP